MAMTPDQEEEFEGLLSKAMECITKAYCNRQGSGNTVVILLGSISSSLIAIARVLKAGPGI